MLQGSSSSELEKPVDIMVGDIHVRSLTFDLDKDLKLTGNEFLRGLFSGMDEGFSMTAMGGLHGSIQKRQIAM